MSPGDHAPSVCISVFAAYRCLADESGMHFNSNPAAQKHSGGFLPYGLQPYFPEFLNLPERIFGIW